jgi:hypothetical protein
MKPPPKKRPGNPVLASDWNTLVDALAARTPRPSVGLELVATSGGFIYRMRQTNSSTGVIPSDCLFGQIITWTVGEGEGAVTKTGIRGGVVYAGDKVWKVEPYELDLSVDGTWVVWLEVGVTANIADDVLLPGLETSTAPTWGKSSGNYPSQTLPTAATPTGTAIIALGSLGISDGTAEFSSAGCGTIVLSHCPGVLAFARGGSSGGSGGSGGGGATGPMGPMGPAGPTGPMGPAGPRGATGAAGADGANGPNTVSGTTTSTLGAGYIYIDETGHLTTTPEIPPEVGELFATLTADQSVNAHDATAPTTGMDIAGTAITLAPGNWHVTGALLATSSVYSGSSAWFGIRFSGGSAVTNAAGSYTKWVPYCSSPAQPAATTTVSVANNLNLYNPVYYAAYHASTTGQYHVFEVDLYVHVAVATSVRLLAGRVNTNPSFTVKGAAGETWLKAIPV